jgi:opacity protein-like surface antigen
MLNFPRQQLGGDLDGQRFYMGTNSIAVVPSVDPAWGIGFGGGIKSRVAENLAIGIELLLNTARHNVSWFGEPGKATSSHLDLDFKLFFNVREKVQPFILSGISASRLKVDGGFLTPTGTKDVTYTGTGFHIGAGFSYYVTPRVSFIGSLRQRWITFNQIDYGDRSNIEPKLKSTALDAAIAAAYHFKLGS